MPAPPKGITFLNPPPAGAKELPSSLFFGCEIPKADAEWGNEVHLYKVGSDRKETSQSVRDKRQAIKFSTDRCEPGQKYEVRFVFKNDHEEKFERLKDTGNGLVCAFELPDVPQYGTLFKAETMGFTDDEVGDDQGELGAENMIKAMEMLGDPGMSTYSRYMLSNEIGSYIRMVPNPLKLQVMKKAAKTMFESIKALILTPDDSALSLFDEYDNSSAYGIQSMAKQVVDLASYVEYDYTKTEWAIHMSTFIFETLEAVKGTTITEKTQMNKTGPGTQRSEIVTALFGLLPNSALAYQKKWSLGDYEDPVVLIKEYQAESMPPNVRKCADDLITAISQHLPDLVKNSKAGGSIAEDTFKKLDSDDNVIYQLNNSLFDQEPEVFRKHILKLVQPAGRFMGASGVLYHISMKSPEMLVPAVKPIMEAFKAGDIQDTVGSMVFNILKGCASTKKGAEEVVPHLDVLEEKGFSVPYCDMMFVMLVSEVVKVHTELAERETLRILKKLNKFASTSIAMALSTLVNLTANLDDPSIYEPYMDEIMKHEGSAAQVVEKIKDFVAGRSLEDAYDRLDALEEMVLEVNKKCSETCANFDEVKAYVDKNISQLKDFVGEIVKKLPQPARLTVVKGMRKTIRLHFECCVTGTEWTCESKDWNKWFKMGFSLIKLGKCVLDLGIGNPFNILKNGVDAVKGVYGAYKEKDDKDFDTYIQEPFLTSAESDKLINQLRNGGFFKEFAYDAQKGGWVCLAAVDKETGQALVDKANKKKPGKDAKTVVKAKGVMSQLGDMAAGAIELVADELKDGDEEDGSTGLGGLISDAQEGAAALKEKRDEKSAKKSKASNKKTSKASTKKTEDKKKVESTKKQPKKKTTAAERLAKKAEAKNSGKEDVEMSSQSAAPVDNARLDALEKELKDLKIQMEGLQNKGGCCVVS